MSNRALDGLQRRERIASRGGGTVATAVWHATMSLDGFIAGPGDSMEWMFRPRYHGPSPQAAEIVESIGAILAGRRVGYDLGRQADLPPGARKPYGGAWSGPVFVLTHHPPEDPDDPSLTFLTCSFREAVGTAAQAAGDKKVVIFGANLA